MSVDARDEYQSLCDELERRQEEITRLRAANIDLNEQVAALQSKEVCAAPHSDEVLEFCPYCKIERLRAALEAFPNVYMNDRGHVVVDKDEIYLWMIGPRKQALKPGDK